MVYRWSFGVIVDYWSAFADGLIVTIALALACVVAATVLGVVLALARTSGNAFVEKATANIILVLRAFPILVLIVWLYYCLPILFGVGFGAFETAFVAISLSAVAYIAEDVRAGIQGIPKGQVEAARNLGLSWLQTQRHVVLPQALRKIAPVLVNEYVTITKFTSLASVIGVQELLHKGSNLISVTYRPLEIYSAVALGYFIVVLSLVLLAKKLEANKK